MRWGAVRRAFGAAQISPSRSFRAVAIAALALGAAGCASQPGAGLASFGPMPVASGATISFDSIDGPPPEVFRKLVASLNDEAQSRKIPVVARSAAATYRVRGYVSAMVDRGKTSFGWVWDIYDADKRRTLRIAGEEPAAAGKRRDAWAAADEPLLRRMAGNGMDRIAAFLNNSTEPPPPAPEAPGIMLVTARDDSPEGAGIFRLFGAGETTGAAPAAEPAPEPAPQPKRAKPAKRPATTAAALDAAR
jgi:hypothetical protein